jgi:hypothetical protein
MTQKIDSKAKDLPAVQKQTDYTRQDDNGAKHPAELPSRRDQFLTNLPPPVTPPDWIPLLQTKSDKMILQKYTRYVNVIILTNVTESYSSDSSLT